MNLSVLQWNVWYLEDIHNVVEFLKNANADVICLQELTIGHPGQTVKDTPAFVAVQLGYSYYHKELPIESTDGQQVMLANGIFSRFPIIGQRWAWINQPKKSGGYDDEYRAYVEITLNVGGRHICVGTTHMSYTHRFEPTEAKTKETNQLLGELRRHRAGFIFSGDLNAVPGSYTVSELGKLLKDAGPALKQKTWTTKPFSYKGFEETELNWRLDYVFTTPDLTVRAAEIIPTDYSDHLPVRATISLG